MKCLVFESVVLFVVLVLDAQYINGEIITANVVVNSSNGQYALLLPGVQNSDWYQYVWGDVPEFFVQQNASFWQYEHTDYPTLEDGVVEFEVLNSGPVLMACTTRWGGGGNSDGDWEDELTTREELEQQGWTEYSTGLTLRHFGYPSEPSIDYVIFSRDCVAGETFSYRTEKYEPPTIIQVVPEPSTLVLLGIVGLALVAYLRRISR